MNGPKITKVRAVEPGDEGNWESFVEKNPEASLYHRIGWRRVIEKSFGHRTFYLLAEDLGKEIAGVLPIVHLKSALFGSFMVSVPYFNYGGICAANETAYAALLEEAKRLGEREKASSVEFREWKDRNNGLYKKSSKVSMILPLPPTADLLWNALGSKLRSQIKRPEKEGFTARIGKEEELDPFYDVFSVNMRDLGTPIYSKAFFRNILHEFPSSSWICSVYTADGKIAASGFLAGFRERLEIPWASSLKAYNRLAPNMLLYWASLRFACDSGYAFFDFGRSTPLEGTYRFKEQWGAKPVQLYWSYWVREGEPVPEFNPHNPKYALAIDLWKRLPVGVTRWLGPHIVKNLP